MQVQFLIKAVLLLSSTFSLAQGNHYMQARQKLDDMLEGRSKADFTSAVFLGLCCMTPG